LETSEFLSTAHGWSKLILSRMSEKMWKYKTILFFFQAVGVFAQPDATYWLEYTRLAAASSGYCHSQYCDELIWWWYSYLL